MSGPYVNVLEIDAEGNSVSESDDGICHDKLYLRGYGLEPSEPSTGLCFASGLIKVSPQRYPGGVPNLQVPQGYINGDNSHRVIKTGFEDTVILDTQLDTFTPDLDEQLSINALMLRLGWLPDSTVN